MASCVYDAEPAGGNNLGPGDRLPQFGVVLSDGREITGATLSKGSAVIVFFNTACEDCRRELPLIEAEYRDADPSTVYVCIAREEAAESIAAYWRAAGLTLPWSAQSDREVYSLFATEGIPRVYRADNGVITAVGAP